jgi:hypothetical protein
MTLWTSLLLVVTPEKIFPGDAPDPLPSKALPKPPEKKEREEKGRKRGKGKKEGRGILCDCRSRDRCPCHALLLSLIITNSELKLLLKRFSSSVVNGP